MEICCTCGCYKHGEKTIVFKRSLQIQACKFFVGLLPGFASFALFNFSVEIFRKLVHRSVQHFPPSLVFMNGSSDSRGNFGDARS